MIDQPTTPDVVGGFIERWEASGAAERANYALFLTELCDLLRVQRPEPTRPDEAENAYVFERSVTFHNGDGSTSTGRIDLYKRGCFVLEAKQGIERAEPTASLILPRQPRRKGTAVRGTAGWDDAMLAARGQAEQYVKALPASEPNPPFLVVVDVGHSIELYADFTRQGRTYIPFPDALSHRLKLRDLADETVRDRLRLVWTDPLDLDPSRRSAKVTRDVAGRLAVLARSLEDSGHSPEAVAQFLMRCLFTFFAEDVGLLPKEGFTSLLRSLKERGETALFPEMVRSLWETMKAGGFSPLLRSRLLRFNGGLFENAEAVPVTDDQLGLLIDAGEKQWRDVEPAIFGTLLERALDKRERHKLGAHFTPRAYVERLVLPTIIEPLRDEWATAQTAAVTLANDGDLAGARDLVRSFHERLCETIILDPACGSANFLYVTLEHMKRLEGEVLDALRGFGEGQAAFEGIGLTVDPHQFRGIEINARAAAIADLVLWIGYLQWHFRTYGNRMPAEPVIKAFHNIECRDALLAYDGTEPVRDESGEPLTRWDGITTKIHPVTGADVPDDTARVPVLKYQNARKALWPKADFVVGNPPFIGGWKMRSALGDGYVEALWKVYPTIPQKADFVMYWWDKAADDVRTGRLRRFGFISTNSVTQFFQRRVLQHHMDHGLSLAFAIPDHPWVDSADGAAVRVAMTVGLNGTGEGLLATSIDERSDGSGVHEVSFVERVGTINAELTIGAAVGKAVPLRANDGVISPGVQLYGDGFIVDQELSRRWGQAAEDARNARVLRRYANGRDLMQTSRSVEVIDFFGFDEERARNEHPVLYQHLITNVKPERDHNARESIRRLWWRLGWERPVLREQIRGLSRFIVTTETAKHRVFVFLDASVLPDNMLTTIALEDAAFLGVLSSRVHVVWAGLAGGTLEDRPRYTKAGCFDPFPFPVWTDGQNAKIRGLAEQLDVHRKRQQVLHQTLTLTGMYNVLAKLRAGGPLNDKERTIHEQGLVSVLKQIHDELDAAVFDAYGWPHDLSDENILRRLVELNRERAAEEDRGVIRWLRPEYQNPAGAPTATQAALPIAIEPEPASTSVPAKKQPWPKSLAEQAQAVRSALAASPAAVTPEQLARTFTRGRADRVADLLDTLVSLGQARATGDGRYVRT